MTLSNHLNSCVSKPVASFVCSNLSLAHTLSERSYIISKWIVSVGKREVRLNENCTDVIIIVMWCDVAAGKSWFLSNLSQFTDQRPSKLFVSLSFVHAIIIRSVKLSCINNTAQSSKQRVSIASCDSVCSSLTRRFVTSEPVSAWSSYPIITNS